MLSDEQKAEILAVAQARSQMREQRPEEYRAAQLLQSLLDGVWFTPRDVSGEQGMHDFDLDLADGRTFAVEVTSDKSQTDAAFQSQVERINPLPAPGLPHSWHVLISSPGEDHTDQAGDMRELQTPRSEAWAGRGLERISRNPGTFFLPRARKCRSEAVQARPDRLWLLPGGSARSTWGSEHQ